MIVPSALTSRTRFALDGTSYEIDLSATHGDQLRAAVSRYTATARRISGARQPARARRNLGGRPDRAQVRDWTRS
ncbi:MAG TPA: histone-like nucleoid-structuring protein Lsr2, partial [Streptosporangiaceae bacterium]|nr:histone-like nucleoid-structuring protein Lsr2 [Streptosporangiaceae bacterium]